MRHRLKGKKLSRTASHRKATMQALVMALIREHRIVTTLAKAKALRGYIEPLITRAKEDTHHNRKVVFSYLQNNEAVSLLFDEVGPKSKDRPGGYTRVIKAGFRKGDGAETAIIELVDYNDIQPEGAKSSSKKRTRRAGKTSAKASSAPASKPEVEKGADTPSAEKMDDMPESTADVEAKSAESISEESTSEDVTNEAEADNEEKEEKKD